MASIEADVEMEEAGKGASSLLEQLLDSGRYERLKKSSKKQKDKQTTDITSSVSFPAEKYSIAADDRHSFHFMRPSLSLIGVPKGKKSSGMEEVTLQFSQSVPAEEVMRGVEEMDLVTCPPRFAPLQVLQALTIPEASRERPMSHSVERTGVSEEVRVAARALRSHMERGALYGTAAKAHCSVVESLTQEEWGILWCGSGPLEGSEWRTAVNGDDSACAQQPNWSGLRQLQRLTGAKGLAELLLTQKSALLWPRGSHVGKAALDLLQEVVSAAQVCQRGPEAYAALMEAVRAQATAACVLAALSTAFVGREGREARGQSK